MQKKPVTPPRKTCRRYEQPTIASKSRSPSPYTNRRMCELSEDSKQRLAHLNLGPYEFKKETESKPPFVVRHMEMSQSPGTTMMSCSARSSKSEDCSQLHDDISMLSRSRPIYPNDFRKMHIDDLQMSLDSLNGSVLESPGKVSPSLSRSAPASILRHPPSPVLNRSSLRQRFTSDHQSSANWEEIHSRVRSLLRTHSPRQKLQFDKSVSWKEPHRDYTSHGEFPSTGQLQHSRSFSQDKSVHLDDGEFWSNKAAAYKGKSHRVIFEESMEKIYRNMYRNALNPNANRKSHHS
ncbi:spermatogenesis-associated protein 6 isoform X2 [Pseudophryne corroboree]|uniref:spermatogenesis-associated protein 6 isoform X2 n=1 Tax=Pseudophryne corroboree TaxID=495146 RepID=UPI0030819FFB